MPSKPICRVTPRRHSDPVPRALGLDCLEDRCVPATFTVTTINDNGSDTAPTAGSLRQAILLANVNADADQIVFAIADGLPGQTPVIVPPTPLPPIANPVTIDGRVNNAPGVELVGQALRLADGRLEGTGLAIVGHTGTSVRGLAIRGFSTQLLADTSTVTLQNNFFGTTAAGRVPTGLVNDLLGTGVVIQNGSATIGGAALTDGNVFAGLAEAIDLVSALDSSSVIRGNLVGQARDGVALPGVRTAILISGEGAVDFRENLIANSDQGLFGSSVPLQSFQSNRFTNNFASFVDGFFGETGLSLNEPTVELAQRQGNQTAVQVGFSGLPNTSYRIVVYWNATQGVLNGELGGNEAEQIVSQTLDTTDAAGNGDLTLSLSSLPPGGWISALVESTTGSAYSTISAPLQILDLVDGFERTPGPGLDGPYSTQIGSFAIGTGPSDLDQGLVARTDLVEMSIATIEGLTPFDVSMEAFVSVIQTGGRGNANLLARYSGPGDTNFYMARAANRINLEGGGIWVEIVRDIAGVRTTLSSTRIGEAVADGNMVIRFEVVGDRLTLWHRTPGSGQFALLDTLVDSALTSAGAVGIRGIGGGVGGAGIDDLVIAELADAAPSPHSLGAQWPATLANVTAYDTAVLPTALDVIGGSFSLGQSRSPADPEPALITGKGSHQAELANAMNTALLAGFRAVDVVMTTRVDVANTGGRGNAALVWRHEGVADQNFYMARLANRQGQFILEIVRDNDGSRTVLFSRSMPSSSLDFMIRTKGRLITLTLGEEVIEINDTSAGALLGAGGAGIRGIGGNLNGARFFELGISPSFSK